MTRVGMVPDMIDMLILACALHLSPLQSTYAFRHIAMTMKST